MICFLVCVSILQEARDAEIVELAVQWRARLNGKISAALPVWASDHWTLLLLERKDPLSDDWTVEYKDSLEVPSAACAKTAKKLLEIASAATGRDLELPPRSNQCTQPKMSGTCGYYVAHWIDAKMREVYRNEPKMSTGTPIFEIMKKIVEHGADGRTISEMGGYAPGKDGCSGGEG